jgi:hypothetical protein
MKVIMKWLNAENMKFGSLSFLSLMKNDTDLNAWMVMYEFKIILIAMDIISTTLIAVCFVSHFNELFSEWRKYISILTSPVNMESVMKTACSILIAYICLLNSW